MQKADPDRFELFRVAPGQAIILDPAVWHGAPIALAQPVSVAVFLKEHTGRDDTYVAQFPDTPVHSNPGLGHSLIVEQNYPWPNPGLRFDTGQILFPKNTSYLQEKTQ